MTVELLGSEDDDLDGVPMALRSLVIEGGSEDGDMLGAGLSLVAAFTGTTFSAADLRRGTVYEIEPRATDLRTCGPDYEYTYELPDAASALADLSPQEQRHFAEWASRAAAREAGIDSEVPIQSVLSRFGDGEPPVGSPSLDALVRSTTKERARFADLEAELEDGGSPVGTHHSYYEATADRPFGQHRALSHLEGAYLAQRSIGAEAVRHSTHPDPLSAAIACVDFASRTFVHGRLTRDWSFREDEHGRWHEETRPNPRHQQFLEAATGLLSDLAEGQPVADAIGRADATLPVPLTPQERTSAIEADARSAAQGDFATYQIL